MKALRLMLTLLAAWLITAPLAAQDLPPRPDGPVYDGANILTAEQEEQLNQRLKDSPTEVGKSVIIATVPDLGGQSIELYAAGLFMEWGIGDEGRDNGLLLLIAPNQRQVRIEVGYGLTPVIPDILSGRIIREDITPKFKEGDMYGGIVAGLEQIEAQFARSPVDQQAVLDNIKTAEANARANRGDDASFGNVFFWIILIVFFISIFGRGGRGRRYRRGGVAGAVGDVILWSAVNSALNSGSRGGGGWSGGGGFGGGGGGGFGGFGGGMSGGGGASGSW